MRGSCECLLEHAPSDADKDGVDVLLLLENLHADGALSGDHVGVVVGVHHRPALALADLERRRLRLVKVVADQLDLTFGRSDRISIVFSRNNPEKKGASREKAEQWVPWCTRRQNA